LRVCVSLADHATVPLVAFSRTRGVSAVPHTPDKSWDRRQAVVLAPRLALQDVCSTLKGGHTNLAQDTDNDVRQEEQTALDLPPQEETILSQSAL
jgi:hypothetical protein